MQLDPEKIINDLLEQNKQLTLQLSLSRVMIAQLQADLAALQSQQGESSES